MPKAQASAVEREYVAGSYKLVIVESPSKCKKIEEYLNGKPQATCLYKCIASFGHIRELAGLEAINIQNNFAPTFTECVSKKEQIAKIKKAVREAEEVILASDDDREGEAIAWHLCQVFKLPIETTKRILFHEITEPALHKAIETPTRINMPMVNAQMARQVLDILVGYKLSPLLWKHVQDGLSAGRCQTPALRLIYDNQCEIDKTPGKQCYTVSGYFTSKNIPFILNYEETDQTRLQEFLQQSLTHQHIYKQPQLKTKSRAAPQPFSTSTLQQTASNECHMSPKETMSVCQKLYEGGYITYPRTDSHEYSEEFIKKAADFITAKYGKEYLAQAEQVQAQAQAKQTKQAKGKVIEKEPTAHEAIRATNLKCEDIDETQYTSRENRIYRLILQRTLESCMAEASVSVLSAVITAPQNHEYHYTAEQNIFPGWKIVGGIEPPSKEYNFLQTVKTEKMIPFKKIKAIAHLKEMKAHFTEARLVQLLEEQGIGRPSTFSSLIEKIQERKYVKKENVKGKMISCIDYEVAADDPKIKQTTTEREFGNEKNKLVIQPVGILALEFLLKHFDTFFAYSYTKEMEDDLDSVAKGEKVWQDICKKCYEEIQNLSLTILERGKEMIRIDDTHTYMVGKYGPVIKCTSKAGTTSVEDTSKEAGTAKASKSAPKTESTCTFKPVKQDLDLNKLRRGEYTLDEILEDKNKPQASIGLYNDKPVYIKVGKFGKYVEWNNVSKSLTHLKQHPNEITIDDITEVLFDMDNAEEGGGGSTRIISEDASLRKGKYGYYIYYKKLKMKKPRFLKLDGFSGDYLTCDIAVLRDWFIKKYQID